MVDDKNDVGSAFNDLLSDLNEIANTGKSISENNDKSTIIHEDLNINDSKHKTNDK